VPHDSDLVDGEAGLSKEYGIDHCGCPAGYNIIGRGCTKKEGRRCRIGPDVIASPRDKPGHYDRTTKGWKDDYQE